jgi:glycosyltransferase involved in cell wall biosynthesis
MDPGKISVVIPTYNRAHCIIRALDSVLAQSVSPHEIIIIDDASSDNTPAVLAPYNGHIRYIRHETNAGASVARNHGIAAANGEWIAFLDSDDAWRPEKLERQFAFMAQYGSNICCTNCDLIWPNGRSEPAYRPYPSRMGIGHYVWGCYTCPGSTLIAHRSILEASGGYDPRYSRYEDWDLFLRLAEHPNASLGFLNEHLADVWRGSSVDTELLDASLDLMLRDHLERLATHSEALARAFRSAIAFSRSSNDVSRGRYLSGMAHLASSFFLFPVGNQAFRIVLLPFLKRHYASLISC